MKITVIISDTKPGELLKVSPLLAIADVVVENGVVVKAKQDAQRDVCKKCGAPQ